MRPGDSGAIGVFAPAKINLALEVLGKRADGYHELDSLVAFADIGDFVSVRAGHGLSLSASGPHAHDIPLDSDNLIPRAARALGIQDADISVEKNLPVASGIGGGSADAAATLLAIRRWFGLDLSDGKLARIGVTLGADVPVCLTARSARMTGVGEKLTPAAIPSGLGVLLVNPGIAVSTPAVFRTLGAGRLQSQTLRQRSLRWESGDALMDSLLDWHNDLEEPARTLCPEIGTVLSVLDSLPGRLIARMSGSGATCFALFANRSDARDAADRMDWPNDWWVRAGALIEGRGE